ncbi:hypothetical protein V8B55DRAFT_1507289 [Mucor lusitanicus]|uniref:F-box domain-containing protein n=2 Tax=Mucor circinelloides f. lusitanicus TaxID=29924 RepID=A0A168Q0K2_MUCCL|nr:hypothetical protein FB192DRAFT_1369065 [Mucor lusitanicus]OAD08511.1 hypothetical protein MUCCIDRAFT_158719 [Mucor lusitanicus CBS 277.49]
MTSYNCSVNQLLPVELLQNILAHVTDIQDIKHYRLSCRLWHRIANKFTKAEVHVRLDSRARAVAFVNDLVQYSFLGPRVDKVSITTEQCDLLDLKNIASFCMNLKRLHFGHDVDMNKYLKMLYSNQVKLPHLQDIQIPKPTCLHNGIFALGIYSRFHKTLSNLELSIDPTLKRLLRRNYGGLAMFVSNFKQLKTLQLNCTRQEGINSVDLQPLLSRHNASLRKIKIDGIGELLIQSSTTGEVRQQEDGLIEITIKSDVLDVQSLTVAIHAMKRSTNAQFIDKLAIYPTFSEQFGSTCVATVLEELSDYYQEHGHLVNTDTTKHSPVLFIGSQGANACRWVMTRSGSHPYLLNWRMEEWTQI